MALAVALVAALVVGAVAVNQRNEASQERQTATARELAAAANANLEIDPERSVLLALAAVELARPVGGSALRQAEQALHEAVYASQIEQRVDGVGGAVAWSPDGDRFAASTADGAVEIRDRATGEVVQTIDAHDDRVNGIAFSPDGALLGTTSEDDTAKLWDLATGDASIASSVPPTARHPDSEAGNDSLVPSFSPDGTWFAFSWWTFGTSRLGGRCRLGSGGARDRRRPAGGHPVSTSFDPTGTMMAVAMRVATSAVAVVDVASGERRLTLEAPDPTNAAWSPDGSAIAVATGTGAYVFDATTGEELFSLPDIAGLVDLDWSPTRPGSPLPPEPGRSGCGASSDAVGSRCSRCRRRPPALASQAWRSRPTALLSSPGLWTTTRRWCGIPASPPRRRWPTFPEWCSHPGGAAEFTGGLCHHREPDRHPHGLGCPDLRTRPHARGSGPRPRCHRNRRGHGRAAVRQALRPLRHRGEPGWEPRRRACCRDDAAANQVAQLRVWDLETWEEPFRQSYDGWVDSAAWSPDSEHLALSLGEPAADRVRGRTADRCGAGARPSRGQVATFRDEDDMVQILSLGFTPDGAQLLGARSADPVSAPFFGIATIWDWRAEAVDRTIETDDYQVVAEPRR